MNTRAHEVAKRQSGISPRQTERIDQSFRENKDNYNGSDDFIAMENDVRMFGDAAFTRKRSPQEDRP
jgi:hypothetical protein